MSVSISVVIMIHSIDLHTYLPADVPRLLFFFLRKSTLEGEGKKRGSGARGEGGGAVIIDGVYRTWYLGCRGVMICIYNGQHSRIKSPTRTYAASQRQAVSARTASFER